LVSEDEYDFTRRKIELYGRHAIDVNPGGILFEAEATPHLEPRRWIYLPCRQRQGAPLAARADRSAHVPPFARGWRIIGKPGRRR